MVNNANIPGRLSTAETVSTPGNSGDRSSRYSRAGKVLGTLTLAMAIMVAPVSHAEPTTEILPTGPSVTQMAESLGGLLNLDQSKATLVSTLTGVENGVAKAPGERWGVVATDLGIPFKAKTKDGRDTIAYAFGDSFTDKGESPDQSAGERPGEGVWHSNTVLFSDTNPSQLDANGKPSIIEFNDAAGVEGDGMAPEVLKSEHDISGKGTFSDIPTSGFMHDDKMYMFFQAVKNWDKTDAQEWATNESYLAVSHDGGDSFVRTNVSFGNTLENDDPFQMISAVVGKDGNLYMTSSEAGRRESSIRQMRVDLDDVENQAAYKHWNGKEWGSESQPLFPETKIGETSLQILEDGTPDGLAVMGYLDLQQGIVTRFADNPAAPVWSAPKVQLTAADKPGLYGGFIHPDSKPYDITFTVSEWSETNYDVSQYRGTLGQSPLAGVATFAAGVVAPQQSKGEYSPGASFRRVSLEKKYAIDPRPTSDNPGKSIGDFDSRGRL